MLSADDREWLEAKFNRLHERIDLVQADVNKKGSDIHRLDIALAEHLGATCPEMIAHEDRYHNPVKTWGIIGAMVGALTGIMELGKWLLKRGGS